MRENANRHVWLVVAVVAALGIAVPGTAGEQPPSQPAYQPPVYGQGQLSLVDAVRIALENEPSIRLQQASTQQQRGVAQQATGQFDASLLGQLNWDYTESELTAREKKSEADKRSKLIDDRDQAGQDAIAYERLIQQLTQARNVFATNGDPATVHFDDPFVQAQFDLYYRIWAGAAPATQQALRDSLLAYFDQSIQDAGAARDQARADQTEKQFKLDRLGEVPKASTSYSGSLSLQLAKLYRTGISFTPYLDLSMNGSGYKGKKKDPDLGGSGVIDSYRSEVGFTVNIPLGRNAGEAATGALEKASLIDVEASVAALTHVASNSVFNAMVAYWNLVGAQERLKVFRQNLELQNKLLELTQTLIQADELPRSELARAQAATATARASVESAQQAEHEARVTLARTVGLQVNDESNAPAAADPFPEMPSAEALGALSSAPLGDLALRSRFDVRAAHQLQESGRVLWRAAQLNLRRLTDLQLGASYSGLEESSSVRDGLKGALTGRWTGPSGNLGITIDWPFANNVQRGLLEQQSALYAQRTINVIDLERVVRSNVVLAVGSLQDAARQLREYEEAVGFYRQSVEAEVEKLRLGTATLIDTIVTQQRLIDAQLAQISSRQLFAQLLAQLRFETGTLVKEQQPGVFATESDFLALPAAGTAGR